MPEATDDRKQPGGPAISFEDAQLKSSGPLEKVYAFWLAGMSCDGCSIAVTGASDPSVEDLLLGRVPGLPRLVLYHLHRGECGSSGQSERSDSRKLQG